MQGLLEMLLQLYFFILWKINDASLF